MGAYDLGLYPLFHLGLKHFFLRYYDFFSFINFPNVLESAHKCVQIDNEIVQWSGNMRLCVGLLS